MHFPSRATKIKLQPSASFEIHGLFEIANHTVILEPLRPTHQNCRPAHIRLHAATGGFRKILRLHQRHAGFAGNRGQRFGGGMVAVFFCAGGEAQQLGGFGIANRREAAHREFTCGQRASFVEHESVDLRRGFNVRDVLDQIPKRAAAESAATIAVGVARMNAHGQETTSTEMTRSRSRVKAQTKAPMTSTSGV